MIHDTPIPRNAVSTNLVSTWAHNTGFSRNQNMRHSGIGVYFVRIYNTQVFLSSHCYVLSSQFNESLNLLHCQPAGKEAQVHAVDSNSLEATYILFELPQVRCQVFISEKTSHNGQPEQEVPMYRSPLILRQFKQYLGRVQQNVTNCREICRKKQAQRQEKQELFTTFLQSLVITVKNQTLNRIFKNVTSVSKKSGQTIVVIQYYSLSRFF